MSEYWPFVVIGLTTGSIYGLAAVGLVLTYRTSGIFNFAHGSIATVGAVLFFLMFEAHDWPWWLAFLDAVVIAGLLMGLLMERIGRRLIDANAAYKVVATLGLVLTVNYFAPTAIRVDNDLLDLPLGSGTDRRAAWLPSGTFEFQGVIIGYDQLIVMVVGVLSAVLLTLMLRRTRTGVQMRAVVDSPDLLDLDGVNPLAVRRAAWILGAMFATLSGALLAPQIGLNFAVLTALVVQATGAAALGGFSNLGLAYVGGLVLGVGQAVATKQFASQANWLSGIPTSLPFLFLFVALLVAPKRLRETFHPLPHRVRVQRHVPVALRVGAYAAIGLVLVLIPVLADFLINWMRYLVYVILFLSLGLLVKTSGQISLGHFAFAAVGAAAFHHFAASAGLPWLLALVLAGLACVPVGALVSMPAIRLSGVFLALATYAFAIALESLGYRTSAMFGSSTSGVSMPRPGIDALASDRGFYYVVLGVVAVVVAVIVAIHHSRLGRLLRALGESPTALQTQGTSVNVTRVLLFCISAFFAGIAGALFGAAQFFVSGADFASTVSLVLLVLVMIAPGGHPWFAFTAAAGLAVLRGDIDLGEVGWFDISLAFQLLFGVLAVYMAMNAYRRRRTPAALTRLWSRIADRVAPPVVAHETVPIAAAPGGTVLASAPATVAVAALGPTSDADGGSDGGLSVDALTVRYGALVAVDDVTLRAPTGRITGLVGPNGAGKSSLFDACTGLVRPARGHVMLHGKDISSLDPAGRARLGLGRTFQRVQLWNALTVAENVALGREGAMAGRNPWRQLRATRSERAEIDASVEAALALCGISVMAARPAGGLTTGQRRLVELARCLAGRYTMLLLDEPSSGLDTAETRRFGEVLGLVVEQRGLGVLLVEHDMALVMDVCAHIHVLEIGHLIFEGSPGEVQMSDVVRSAYLGTHDVVATTGG